MADEYKYLGNFSAAPPWHSVSMSCDECRVSWTGCWDNFECPKCGRGELPSYRGFGKFDRREAEMDARERGEGEDA